MTAAGSYVLRFGKHRGKRLADVPAGYLNFLYERLGLSGRKRRRNETLLAAIEQELEDRVERRLVDARGRR